MTDGQTKQQDEGAYARRLEGIPILGSGDSHPAVDRLGRLLADAGYDNSVARGENPFHHVDESIMAAATQYGRDQKLEDAGGRVVPLSVWDKLLPRD